MDLLVDCGNTRFKWVQWQDGRLREESALRVSEGLSQAELAQCWVNISRPSRILIASVANESVTRQICAWAERTWHISPEIIQTQAQGYGVMNGYRQPETLGVDRWLALIAARHHCALPACIVDCGTALTLDVLESNGQHRGGVICPGLNLMGQALLERASGIQTIMKEYKSGEILADNTGAAVQAGAFHALVGFLERMHRQLPKLHWIITGGDAAKINQELSFPCQWVPDLVWKGMVIVGREQ